MTFNWVDYLKFAKITKMLTEIEEEDMPFFSIPEAAHRAVISRAYYAVFSICCSYLIENRSKEILLSKSPSVHGEVISFFKASSIRAERKIGTILGEMRDNRNDADYQDELQGLAQNISTDAIAQANEILDLIKIL